MTVDIPPPTEYAAIYHLNAEPLILSQTFMADIFARIEFCGGAFYSIREGEDFDVSPIERKFDALAAQWKTTRRRGANVSDMVLEAPYQKIIGMGQDALPQILRALAQEPDHWFWALHVITDENPVPPEAEGNIQRMSEAWLEWGRANGIIS